MDSKALGRVNIGSLPKSLYQRTKYDAFKLVRNQTDDGFQWEDGGNDSYIPIQTNHFGYDKF